MKTYFGITEEVYIKRELNNYLVETFDSVSKKTITEITITKKEVKYHIKGTQYTADELLAVEKLEEYVKELKEKISKKMRELS